MAFCGIIGILFNCVCALFGSIFILSFDGAKHLSPYNWKAEDLYLMSWVDMGFGVPKPAIKKLKKLELLLVRLVLWEFDIISPLMIRVFGCWLQPPFLFERVSMVWSDVPIWHSLFISMMDGTFVILVLGCGCFIHFGDLDKYHCYFGFGMYVCSIWFEALAT